MPIHWKRWKGTNATTKFVVGAIEGHLVSHHVQLKNQSNHKSYVWISNKTPVKISILEKNFTSLINIFSQLSHCFMSSIKLFRTDCRSQTTPNCIQSMLVVWWCQLNEFSKPEIRSDVIMKRKLGLGQEKHTIQNIHRNFQFHNYLWHIHKRHQ